MAVALAVTLGTAIVAAAPAARSAESATTTVPGNDVTTVPGNDVTTTTVLPAVVVTIAAVDEYLYPRCSDVVYPLLGGFELRRSGDLTESLDVEYSMSTRRRSARDERAEVATIPAQQASVTVPFRTTSDREIFSVDVQVDEGEGYTVGSPGRLEGMIGPANPPLDESGHYECGWRIAAPSLRQQVVVGATPAPLRAEQYLALAGWVSGTGRFRVVRGDLPANVVLGGTGEFSGVATEAGTYVATVEVCRLEVESCAEGELEISVTARVSIEGGAEDVLPRTGAESARLLVPLATALAASGALAAGAARARRRGR